MSPTVLIVDDDQRFAAALRRSLQHNGFNTITVDDGSEVADALSRKRVDALLLDLQMPGMSGWEVLRALGDQLARAQLARGRPKIVVMSGRDEAETVAFVHHLGADAYLTKPASQARIVRTLREVLTK